MAVEISTKKFKPAKLVERRISSNINRNNKTNVAVQSSRVMNRVSRKLESRLTRISKNLKSKGYSPSHFGSEVKLGGVANYGFNKT